MRPLIKALDAKVHFLYVNTPDHFTPEDEAEKQMGNLRKVKMI
ncbi:hypothetical protein QWY93_18270 [Echinicola jeungdonensis]|nr:hypothetical protein [Echinicola jeungdonensis]MDN3671252.1 hypothetical protein [Echinicola jeungdonensis]